MDITQYVTFDKPVPYKILKFYPVTVLDYIYFNIFIQCLLIEKNYIPDVKIISMTNLEYIYHTAQTDIEKYPYLLYFDRLLSLCLKDEKSFEKTEESIKRYGYDEKGKPVFTINGEIFNSTDFEEIKKIICEQNLVELPDENISKEVRDSLQKAKDYKDKLSGNKPGSLEDYLVSISTVTGWTFEYLYSMPIRKFIKAVRRLDNFIHYKIYLTASMSGMVEFKDKSFIKHWLTNIDEQDKFKDVSVDLDTIQDKISMESAKN